MLELASLFFDLDLIFHAQAGGKQTFGQAVATNDVGGFLSSTRRELDDGVPVGGSLGHAAERIMTGVKHEFVGVRSGAVRMGDQQPEFGHFFDGNGDRQQTVDLHAAHFRLLAMLLNDPDFL